ncbi:MAG: adenosylcobinamide amidohydrolase [Ilumatobacteraceae bacterium]
MSPSSPQSDLLVCDPDDRGWIGIGSRWAWDQPVRIASSAFYGGGIGDRSWIANLTVDRGYSDPDPVTHAAAVAHRFGDPRNGAMLMTALDVRRSLCARREGVEVQGSVAIGAVCWAADTESSGAVWRPGTVNLIVWIPEPLADSALLNVMTTVAEAKSQAFRDLEIPGTSTPSDAIAVACPIGTATDRGWYGGPRSHWGSRVARVAHRLVLDGVDADGANHGIDDDGSWRTL